MENQELITHLDVSESLRDSFIKKITISFSCQVSLLFEITTAKGEMLLLNFKDIKEYLIFDREEVEGDYLISNYKLFKTGELFYFSFDPYTESSIIEPEDNNYILFENFSSVCP